MAVGVHPFKGPAHNFTTLPSLLQGDMVEHKTDRVYLRPHVPYPHDMGQMSEDNGILVYDDYFTTQESNWEDVNLFQNIPSDQIQHIIKLVAYMENNSDNGLGSPHLRPIYVKHQTLLYGLLLMYSILVVCGILANLLILVVILKRGLHKDPIQACVLNINIASIFQLTVVLPLSVFVLTVRNWLLGQFFCFALPLMQDLPSYVMMISLLILSIDRQQQIAGRSKTSWVPTRLLLPLTWILSLILVLPYLKFISFLSLDSLGLAFKGGQMCAVNMENNVAPYMRGMFVVLFLVPVVLSLGLMWTVWDNLTHIQTELSGVGLQDIQDNEGSLSLRDNDSVCEEIQETFEREGEGGGGGEGGGEGGSGRKHSRSEFSMRTGNRSQELLQSLDIHKEKRAQKFLVLILSSHFLCVLPINVLKLVRYSVVETYENESAYDLAYGILVFITFLPTLILPFFYSRWILIGSLWSELLKLGAGFTTPPQQNVFLEQDIFVDQEVRRSSQVDSNRRSSQVDSNRRSSQVESFREEVERHVRDMQTNSKVQGEGGRDTKVMETVLLRRASIMSTAIVNENMLQPIELSAGNRRQSFEPTHLTRKSSYKHSSKRRRYSVQHS